jgi:hypothetical protein
MSISLENNMTCRFIFVTIASAIALSSLASCGAEPLPAVEKMPPSPPPTAAGTASGKGTLKAEGSSKDSAQPPGAEIIEFTPTSAYAYPARVGAQRTTWIVVADQALDIIALDAADNRQGLLQRACADKHVRYTALELDSKGVPMESKICAGDGRLNTAQLSPDSTISDRGSARLEVNDGKHLKGSMAIGVGSSRLGEVESFAETTGEYQFDVDLSPPSLRDRVQAGGDEHATGVPAAKAALLKYFAAAGTSKSLADVAEWLTPESREFAETKFANAATVSPTFARRIYETFVKSHSQAPTITAARAIGAAAVITTETSGDSRPKSCEALLLQIDGSWKVGEEICRAPGNP